MRPMTVFLLAVLAGATATLIYTRLFEPEPHRPVKPATDAAPAPGKRAKAAADRDARTTAPDAPAAAGNALSPPAPPAASSPEPRADSGPAPTDVELAQARAARLAAEETMTREQLGGLLQTSLAGKLADRELTPSDYDRIADAILRIRASQRVLKGISESDPGAEVRGVHTDVLHAAFEEIKQITGVSPADMGDVLAAQEPVENPSEDLGRNP